MTLHRLDMRVLTSDTDGMSNERMGAAIGAVFGLVYVLVNAGELPSGAGLALRILGVAAFAGLVVTLVTRRDEGVGAGGGNSRAAGFSRGYWIVVVVEVIALFGGLRLINGPLDIADASVGWVSLVVGLHFVALAVVWHNPFVRWLGVAIALCGAIGLALAIAGASVAAIAVISSVVPGFLLLGTGWWYALGRGDRPLGLANS